MTKDVKIALGAGFFIGIISALVAINIMRIVKDINQSTDSKLASITPTVVPKLSQTTLSINIDEPKNESIIDGEKAILSGKTEPENYIVIDTNEESYIKEASSDGTFEFEFDIQEGANDIYISAYNNNLDRETKIITIFKTSEKL